jgi:hypothetical protein
VIPAVLRSRNGVEIKVDTNTIFASPFDGFEEVSPGCLGKEWFSGVDFDSPEGEWDTDPVEAGCGDLSEIFFGDESIVVVCDGVEITVAGLDEGG